MLKFTISGSKGDQYQIIALKTGTGLTLTCTCPAGQQGQFCKHRQTLLEGEISSLSSGNEADISGLKQMISGTVIEQRYHVIRNLEKEMEAVAARLKAEKKAFARELGKPATP